MFLSAQKYAICLETGGNPDKFSLVLNERVMAAWFANSKDKNHHVQVIQLGHIMLVLCVFHHQNFKSSFGL